MRKLWVVFRKSLVELRRDLLMLVLSLSFGPFMVMLYWLFYAGGGSTTYEVLVLNNDQGAAGTELVEVMHDVNYTDGVSPLKVKTVTDRDDAEASLRERKAEVLLIVPEDFSSALAAAHEGERVELATVTFVGDLTNPLYVVAAVMADAALRTYVEGVAGIESPIQFEEVALGGSATRTEFETYIPGLLVFAVIILVYQVSLAITREVEAGTLRRLQLTRMTALDLLGGMSGVVLVTGVASILLTYLTAAALGFHSEGALWVAVAVSAVSGLSIIGAGLIVAAFSKTATQATLIATFPLAIFMFFTGAALPLPAVHLFTVAGRSIGLYDILPPTHAVNALNKILTLGMGFEDVLYEIAAMLILSVIYFAAGVWLFKRTHMRAA
jgi:ABC-2 type transport system permease protein